MPYAIPFLSHDPSGCQRQDVQSAIADEPEVRRGRAGYAGVVEGRVFDGIAVEAFGAVVEHLHTLSVLGGVGGWSVRLRRRQGGGEPRVTPVSRALPDRGERTNERRERPKCSPGGGSNGSPPEDRLGYPAQQTHSAISYCPGCSASYSAVKRANPTNAALLLALSSHST